MAAFTLAEAEAELAFWVAQSRVVGVGQEFSHNGRTFKRAPAADILEWLKYYRTIVNELSRNAERGGIRSRGATPIG